VGVTNVFDHLLRPANVATRACRTALTLRIGDGLVKSARTEQSEIMKTETPPVLVLLLGVLLGHQPQAFYNPSTGRWLRRFLNDGRAF